MRASLRCVFALLLVISCECLSATSSLVATGANWKYLDDGSDQGTAWRDTAFDDSAWASGRAELGYGDGDEATAVSFGPDSLNKYITTYFRRTFFAVDVNSISALTLNVLRDDGAVVYLNGTEVFRDNMPAGTITAATPALVAIGGTGESTYLSASVSPALLREGANVIAVEIHQSGGSSSDISFNLSLVSTGGAAVTRGPYLNSGTSGSMVVRWRTDVTTNSRVRIGAAENSLNSAADVATSTTEHEVLLTGLNPDTKYFYNISSSSNNTTSNDAVPFFYTLPAPGTNRAVRIWATGDFGTGSTAQKNVYNAFRSVAQSTYTNVWLMLGDNAYSSGLDSEYQTNVFDVYPDLFRKTVVWPAIGNHDAVSADSPTQTGVYFNIFTLPKNGEAGGLASGTEAYYSFDFGRVHFVCMDSQDTDTSTGGAMLTWLQNDLSQTLQDWILVYFHHPPYTKGSHDSDSLSDSGGRMVAMRQNALPIMEAYGVDLCLTGHSHCYERSYLIDGHYGFSSSFVSSMKIDGGNGREDGTGAYQKPSLGTDPHKGAVYSVVGSSGQIAGGPLNHPAHFISLNVLGSMIIDINGDRLDAQFVTDTGAIQDHFTIRKGATPVAVTGFSAE